MRPIYIVLFIGLLGMNSGCNSWSERPSTSREETRKNEEQTTIRTADTSDINKWMANAATIDLTYPDSAIALYKEAIQASKDIHYTTGAAKAYYSLPFIFKYHGRYAEADAWQEKATLFMKQAIVNAQIPRDGRTVRLMYCYLTLLYARWNDWPQTLATYQSAQPFFDKKDSLQLIQWLQISTEGGNAFVKSGQYDSASTLFYNVLDQFENLEKSNYYVLSTAYMGIGVVKARMEAAGLEETLTWFKKAEQLGRQFADTGLILNSLTNITSICYDKEKYTEAKEHGKAALDLAASVSNKRQQLYIQQNISHTLAASLIKEDSAAAALPYSQMSLEAARQMHSVEEEIDALYVNGYNYVALGRYREAEHVLLDGLNKARETGKMDNISNAYGQLSVAYEKMGRYKEAYAYRRDYANIRDSLLGKENATRIAEVNARYQIAQKDKELAEKDKALLQNQLRIASQEKKQYLWIGGSLICILVLLGVLYQKKQSATLNRLKATIAGEENERSRLARELHDGIVNRLSIIKMNFSALPRQYQQLTEAEEFQDVVTQLEQSIAELRTTSHNLLPDTLQRAGLQASLETYCEKIRKIALLDISFQVIGELPQLSADFQLNIYRIIQELVNNIIKHSDAKCALIQFNIQKDWLTITVDHDGTPPETEAAAGNGIGLYNLRERVRLLNGTLDMEHEKSASAHIEFHLRKFIQTKEKTDFL